ncbi:hypothetical protein [Nonomuraea sp. NPDC001831]|uniref:hypothetical protein n=1 Tax=Nonomuraea sp. NPDC001831 TaxID=3364340 RepID=UPI0036998D96
MSAKATPTANTQTAAATTASRPLRRIVTVALAVVATAAALLATAPSASAQGNCTHYGQEGWGQMFTDINYQGDCFEWTLGQGTDLPAYMKNKVSSLRIWTGWPAYGATLYDFDSGTQFYAGPNEWWPSLPGWFNDKADRVTG